MIVSPAMAGTDRPGDDKDPKNGAASTSADKDKTADATANTAKPNAAATPSSLETEIQQLRDLIENQSKLLQAQSEQLKEQQHRMQVLESQISSSSNPEAFAASVSGSAPDSHTAGVASVPVAGVPTSSGRAERSGQAAGESPLAIHFKGITISPGGFLAAETVFRNKAVGADINTGFNNIPFPGNSGGQTTEWNSSARQSRLSMLAEGRLASVKLSGYVETDFDSTAKSFYCTPAGGIAPGAVSGLTVGAGGTCNPNNSWWQVGSRTQWNPHPHLDIGVDVLWTHINTAFAGSTITAVSGAQPQAGPMSDQDVLSVFFRVQRNFLP